MTETAASSQPHITTYLTITILPVILQIWITITVAEMVSQMVNPFLTNTETEIETGRQTEITYTRSTEFPMLVRSWQTITKKKKKWNILGLYVPADHQIYKVPTVGLATADRHPATKHNYHTIFTWCCHAKCKQTCLREDDFLNTSLKKHTHLLLLILNKLSTCTFSLQETEILTGYLFMCNQLQWMRTGSTKVFVHSHSKNDTVTDKQ